LEGLKKPGTKLPGKYLNTGRYGKLIAVFYGKLIAKYGKVLAVYNTSR